MDTYNKSLSKPTKSFEMLTQTILSYLQSMYETNDNIFNKNNTTTISSFVSGKFNSGAMKSMTFRRTGDLGLSFHPVASHWNHSPTNGTEQSKPADIKTGLLHCGYVRTGPRSAFKNPTKLRRECLSASPQPTCKLKVQPIRKRSLLICLTITMAAPMCCLHAGNCNEEEVKLFSPVSFENAVSFTT